MSDQVKAHRERLLERILNSPGVTSAGARRAAFDNRDVAPRARGLIGKVAQHAWKVTDSDVAGAKAAGMAEDEIFELTVCAAIGQAARQLQSALDALDTAAPLDAAAPAAASAAPASAPPDTDTRHSRDTKETA